MSLTMPSPLNQLPTELLQQICAQLCLHCQQATGSSAMPQLDTTPGRVNKHALAQLCHSNSVLRSIAQPVLFHYFVVNSAAQSVRAKHLRARLSKFLWTVCQRPDLAMTT